MERWTGFFGKMPATGDFVARGLPAGLRVPLDRWLTEKLRPLEHWPDYGVCGLIKLADMPFVMIAAPSEDRLGRTYPLALLADGDGVSLDAANRWCAQVLPELADAVEGLIGPDELAGRLAAAATSGTDDAAGPMALWPGGAPPDQDTSLSHLLPGPGE